MSVADEYDLPLGRLLEFNDMKEQDVLERDQLLFLQRKRKTGSTEIHQVQPDLSALVQDGESIACEQMAMDGEVLSGVAARSGGCRPPPAKTRCRLCVMLPLPTISTPSSASGASAWPSANSCAGDQLGGQASGSTGMSACGNM